MENELPFVNDPQILSAELRRLNHERHKLKRSISSQKFSHKAFEKKIIFDKTNGLCHICGNALSPEKYSITYSLLFNEQDQPLPACKSCKTFHDNYLSDEIKWIIKLGLWAKTQIEYETEIGQLLAEEFIDYEQFRENGRQNPREPYFIEVKTYPVKENFILNPKVQFNFLGELLYWSYSNLSMAYNALDSKIYGRMHKLLRKKLYEGLINGSMNIRSMFIDEKHKLIAGKCCMYCGELKNLQIDHIIPRNKGGKDSGENLVWACKKCNASKCDLDLMEWYNKRGEFPPLQILRNYLKLIIQHCIDNNLMQTKYPLPQSIILPFNVEFLPLEFPNPEELFVSFYVE